MRKVFSIMVLVLLLLAIPKLSVQGSDEEFRFVTWIYKDGILSWYISIGAKYDGPMGAWVLTDAARLADGRLIRLLTVALPRDQVVAVEHFVSVTAEDLH